MTRKLPTAMANTVQEASSTTTHTTHGGTDYIANYETESATNLGIIEATRSRNVARNTQLEPNTSPHSELTATPHACATCCSSPRVSYSSPISA